MLDYRNKDTYALSMGQKQRIAIAEMLALNPKYLVLDEPTAMLDPVSKKKLIETVKQLNKKENITVVYVTNVISEILDADRIIALNEGKIIFECTPKTILQNVNNFKQIGLEIPQMVELVEKLNKNGLNIDTDRFDMDLIIEQIIRGAKC
jgi:energy-coupling factor transport system ATP-binding protein